MRLLFVSYLQLGEPEWMLDFRLKSLETFKKMPIQTGGRFIQILILMVLFIRSKSNPINLRVIGDDVPAKNQRNF